MNAYASAFMKDMIRLFQKDSEMRSVIMTDKDARDQATQHFFRTATRQLRQPGVGAGATSVPPHDETLRG